MIIQLSRMPADGLTFNHQYTSNELDVSGYEFEVTSLTQVTGRVDRTGMDMLVRGEIKSEIASQCDRCLIEVHIPIKAPFDLIYVPAVPGTEQTGERELLDRELDLAFYENEQINLDDLVIEQLELSLPMQVLCRQDCCGLCSECGADLNHEPCRCQKPIDPRWQALADLKKSEEEN
ncbi:MAG: YceD family protein [Blastocatellia bacterium]